MKRAKKASTAQAVGRSGRTDCSDVADYGRVVAWAKCQNRKPPQLAFTAGPERQAAYWISWAWNNPNTAVRDGAPCATSPRNSCSPSESKEVRP